MTLNERISAWFEPRPTKEVHGNSITHSPKRAWIHMSQYGDRWCALNWDTDEAANAQLLEAMPEPELSKVIQHREEAWRCDPYSDGELKYSIVHPDRKTAVLLAFCKSAGIDSAESEARNG